MPEEKEGRRGVNNIVFFIFHLDNKYNKMLRLGRTLRSKRVRASSIAATTAAVSAFCLVVAKSDDRDRDGAHHGHYAPGATTAKAEAPPPSSATTTPVRIASIPSREGQISRLQLASSSDQEFDVLVVGGGATGAGAALDAATRGLSTALIERGDFGNETSSRST